MAIIGLYARYWDPFTGETREPITGERCWKCGRPKPDLAHAVFEYIAAVLGAELQRRIDAAIAEHVTAHGCSGPGRWNDCPHTQALWDLLPDGMRPVAIG